MKLLWPFLFLFISFSVLAQDDILALKNDREGVTTYNGIIFRHRLDRITKKISNSDAQNLFNKVLGDQKKLCSFEINQSLILEFNKLNSRIRLKNFLYQIRGQNLIDDIVLGILLKANEVSKQNVFINEGMPQSILQEDLESKIRPLIISFEKRFLRDTCMDEAYKTFYQELLKIKKDITSFELAIITQQLLLEDRISQNLFIQLEQARKSDLQSMPLTINSYIKKKQSLRLQYPLRDINEKSHFVTKKPKRSDLSRRQRLYEQYTDLQIILMGNVIKRLRSRLESPKVEILVYDQTAVSETIELEPMERFRFAIKVLRKEMATLSLNTYFSGRAPSYEDLMTASYEIGIIPASELDEIADLEEIWNPRRTFWDKAGIWIQTFSSIATIVIPPPYGFLPALGVVVIQATQKNESKDDSGSLF